MPVELGARVFSSDGQDVGRVDKLIVDAGRNEVTDVVIRKGFLLHRDVQVPLGVVQVGPAGELRLTYTAERLNELPAYVEPTAGATALDADSGTRPDLAVMFSQYDLEHAVVKEGSTVTSQDGKTVGHVHRLTFDPDSGHLTHLSVRQGMLFTHDVELPATLVAGVGMGEIRLTVTAAEVATWAALRDGMDVRASDGVPLGTIASQQGDYLEIVSPDEARSLFVPITQVAQVQAGRVMLTADYTQAAQWRTPPDAAASAGPAEPSA